MQDPEFPQLEGLLQIVSSFLRYLQDISVSFGPFPRRGCSRFSASRGMAYGC